jgi:hypothetical protein
MTNVFAARGYDAESARNAALRVLGGVVNQQAMVVTFDRLFLLAGLLFLTILPLLYFLKSPDHAPKKPAEVHAEI